MRPFRKAIGILIGVLSASIVLGADTKRLMTVDDGLKMKRIDDVIMSPNGDSVLYTVKSLNWAKNKIDSEHFIYREGDRSTHKFIGEDGGEQFRFSPDGKHLAFLRDSDSGGNKLEGRKRGKSQLFVMPTSGGEASQLTDHKGGLSAFQWKPSGKGFIFLADDMGKEDAEKERELGDDSYYVDMAPNGKHASRYTSFWSIDLNDKKEEQLSKLELVVGDFDVSPDGGRIVFDARPDARTNHPEEAELYLYSVKQRVATRLTNNAAPESNAIWSPDGEYIAYRAPDDKTFELRSGYFWIMEPESKETRRLDGQSTGELSTEPAWTADGRHVLYNEIHGTNTNLYRINIESGEAQALTEVKGTLRAHSFSADTDRMVYSFQNFTTPADLHVGDLRARRTRQITELNPWVKESLALTDGQLVQWTSKGDMIIEGVFYAALGTGTGKSPLVVNIHGGPAGVIENAFRHDFQILAGQGFAVLAPNFRGSTGYGDKVLRGLIGEVGDGEFVDIMTGVDHTIAEKNIDPNRLGVRGWSWGGVSTSFVITRTDRFKAASIGAMVGNWAAETGPGFNFDVSLWYIGGMPWDNPEEWRQRSSITHVKNVSTPSIIFHGGDDETSSVGQSLMFYTARREIGKIEEPRHRRRLEIEEMAWFKRHIENEEWQAEPPDFDDQ
jgi:dipeptidyl aminopeptidase/acylaminoacyl peptidase